MGGVLKLQRIRILGLVVMLSTALLLVNPPGMAQQTNPTGSSTATEKETEKLPGLAELVHKATILDEKFSDLQRRFPKIYDNKETEERFAAISEKLAKLKEKTQQLQSSDKLNYQDLAALKSAFQQVLPERSGYVIREFKIRGILEGPELEDSGGDQDDEEASSSEAG